MIEQIEDLIKTEGWNLEEAEAALKDLDGKWFKFGKKQLIEFLKTYIDEKKDFIKKLKQHKQKLLSVA